MSRKKGLFFGSFNPVHTGHLLVANHILNFSELEEIHFVLSPQNPFKNASGLLDENTRLEILKMSILDNPRFVANDIEFGLPRPSYTIQTLKHLMEKEPETGFSILMGSDNLAGLGEWKDIGALLKMNEFHVYGRRGTESLHSGLDGKFHFYDAPFIDISATHIRTLVKENKSIKYLVHHAAEALIQKAFTTE